MIGKTQPLRRSEDVAQLAQLEPLGSVPLRIPGTSPADEDIITQAFVTISTNFRMLGREKRSLLITGLRSGAGTSTTASKLARALAQSGVRVLLIDTHISKLRQHEIFKVSNARGLTNSLDDVTTLLRQPSFSHAWLQQWATNVPNLFLLPAGPQGAHVETMQWVSKLQMLTEWLLSASQSSANGKISAVVDVIVFDAPALDEGVDAIALAPVTDGTVLVVEAGKEYAEALHKAQATLQRLGSPIVGVVVNRQQAKHQSYFYAGRPQQAMEPVESSRLSREPKYPVLQTREFMLQKLPETPMPVSISPEAGVVYSDVARLDTVSVPNTDINTNTARLQRDSVFKPNTASLLPSKNNGFRSNDRQGGQ